MKRNIKSLAALAVLGSMAVAAHALPTGGTVAAGSATISTLGNTLTVNNNGSGAVINWNGFSIASGETARFNQPSASSTVLNRVVGVSASSIFGALASNGRVFLVNPNGILFGAGARVDVGALVASSLNISDANFLAGNYQFSAVGSPGAVINQGTIATSSGGYIALLAPQVSNTGVINAPGGVAALGAGDPIDLGFTAGVLTSVNVGQNIASPTIDLQGIINAPTVIISTPGSASSGGGVGGGLPTIGPITPLPTLDTTSSGGVILLNPGTVTTGGNITTGGTISLTTIGDISLQMKKGVISIDRLVALSGGTTGAGGTTTVSGYASRPLSQGGAIALQGGTVVGTGMGAAIVLNLQKREVGF